MYATRIFEKCLLCYKCHRCENFSPLHMGVGYSEDKSSFSHFENFLKFKHVIAIFIAIFETSMKDIVELLQRHIFFVQWFLVGMTHMDLGKSCECMFHAESKYKNFNLGSKKICCLLSTSEWRDLSCHLIPFPCSFH